MVRGVPWDELPGVTPIGSKGFDWTEVPEGAGLDHGSEGGAGGISSSSATPAATRDFKKDFTNTLRRVAFGGIIGGISGAAFGSVDVVKDVKGMLAKRADAAKTVMRYSYRFGFFNAAYQSSQYVLSLYSGLDNEICIGAAAAGTIAPLLYSGTLRGMVPYAACLVIIDCISAREEGRAFK